MKVRLGIIGIGGIGKVHYENAKKLENVEIKSICDIDKEKLKDYSRYNTFTDYKQMLDEGGFDGVIISTPVKYHTEQAIYALKKGYYVFLEKPLSTTLEDAKKIAKMANGKLMVGFTLRFVEIYQKMKDILDEKLGKPILMWHIGLGTFPSAPWLKDPEVSGGILNEHGVHVLYQYVWYAGLPKKVYAKFLYSLGYKVEDSYIVEIEHESGTESLFMLSWRGGHTWRKWGVDAEKGRVVVEGYTKGQYTITSIDGKVIESGISDGVKDPYMEEIKEFINSIINHRSPIVNEKDGLIVQTIVEASKKSVSLNKPVSVSELINIPF